MKLRFVILLGLGIIMSGCTFFAPKPFSPIEKDYPRDLNPTQILLLLEERHSLHPRLWARGKITLSGKRIKGKKHFQATLLYEEPDRLRLRGSRMITSTLFESIINGDRMAFILNKENEWYEGAREEWNDMPEASLGLDPMLLPQVLLVQQQLIGILKEQKFQLGHKGKHHYLFVVQDKEGNKKAFLVRTKDLFVEEAALYDKQGLMKASLRFLRYNRFGEDILPMECETVFPGTQAKARIEIKEYKYPPYFQKQVFSLSPPSGMEVLPLRSLLEPSPM